ncbi:uncharacterized protein SAPINGB_P006120 [Magnusiomyces paraingens]|uniref:Anoctamin dimerisation domain-containing protein n=1 Tax=Magnusiomyces paraingens TaxID=2606893 RepID=A0A5E8CAI2_9ASCO|nr:uncharacterized protein SAPINGB_P006120 [Saprochaete ingens]VVT58266.1 unnamed protein product [Saprochaete ingens]
MSASPADRPVPPKETGSSLPDPILLETKPTDSKPIESTKKPAAEKKTSTATSLPELNPDYVIEVKVSTDPKDNQLNESTLEKLVSLLITSGFYVQIRQGNPGSVFVFIKTTFDLLRTLHINAGIQDYQVGVQRLIPKGDDLSIESLDSKISPAEKLRLVYEFLTSPKYEKGLGITPALGEWSFVTSIFPLTDHDLNAEWFKRWKARPYIDDQEIDFLRSHFGEKVAFYFAYLHFYTSFLFVPAILGFFMHFFIGCYTVFFGLFNIVWGVLFIHLWKRKENLLALRWGVKGSSAHTTPRSAFKPNAFEMDKITGVITPTYSYWRRVAKQLVSVPLILGAVAVIFLLQSLALVIEIFIVQVYHGPLKPVLKLIPTVVLAAIVPTVVAIYRLIILKIIGWENHETDDSFDYSFNQKLFSVSFITSTGSMFLTAFVYLPFGHLIIPHLDFVSTSVNTFIGRDIASGANYQVNGNRLEAQVLYMMVTAQIISTFTENVLPYFQVKALDKVDQFLSKGTPTFEDTPEESKYLEQVRASSKLPEFSVDAEYQEMVLQFSFVNIFGVAWSLAPFAGLLNNWFELRGDAAKIVYFTRRPIPKRTDSIGSWGSDLRYVTWIGTVVTTSLVIMYGPTYQKFADLSKGGFGLVNVDPRILLAALIFAEHFYFILNRIVALVLSKFPTPEELEDQKEQYLIRKDFVALQLANAPELSTLEKRESTPTDDELVWKAISNPKAQAIAAIKATVESYIAKTTEAKKNN